MTGKQTFTDEPSRRKRFGILLGVWIFMVICSLAVGSAQMGLKFNLLVLGGFLLILFLGTQLGYNLTKFHVINCDLVGCEVKASGKWRASQTDIFRWDEVIDTCITSQVFPRGGRIFYFRVGVGDKWIVLLQTGSAFSIKDFAKLIATVNERTQHLPFVWVERKPVDNRQVIQEVGIYYYKVARS
ncbi:MAG: hypothetical protein M3362_11225 [Acidobacteriota bacterium]|nr:hypothetical protein [Acidobacteriota bacterium]